MLRKLLLTMVAAAAVLALAGACLAAESPGAQVIINGRLLTDIGYWNKSKELTANGTDDVTTAFVNVPSNTYLRARWRSSDGTTGGLIELGLKSLQPTASVSLRRAYGWYQYGRCRLLVGHNDNWFGNMAYAPSQLLGINNDSHAYLWAWGFLWPSRVPQVQFTVEAKTWGVQFAVEAPRNQFAHSGNDLYFVLPRMSLTAMFKAGGFMTHPGFSFVRHSYEGVPGPADDQFDTWAVVLPVKFTSGAFTLKFQAHHGKNFYNEYPYYPEITEVTHSLTSFKLQDTFVLGGMLSLEYKLGAVTLIGGVGYEKFENESWKRNGWKDDNADRKAVFVAVPYQVNDFFGLHPEFSYYDHGDNPVDGKDAGTEWMLGVQFRFIF